MSKFTYEVQLVDFFIDHIEKKGAIDLNGAVDAFQQFPFEEQLLEASNRELTSCLPSIHFISDKGPKLSIWARDINGFFIHYKNGFKSSEIYISNNFYENKVGVSAEEFIETFFNETIEESIDLTDDPMEQNNTSELLAINLTFSFSKYRFILWPIVYFIIAIIIIRIEWVNDGAHLWGINIIIGLFSLPGFIIHLTYWIKNRNAKILINTLDKTLIYSQNNVSEKFHRDEIVLCEINESRSFKAPWRSYRYLYIILKDNRKIVITNFIVEPETIINSLNLNYSIDERTAPFLPI